MSNPKRFLIKHFTDDLFWNKDFGWVNEFDCDSFSEEEVKTMILPGEGQVVWAGWF
jgi:hypothetical protein